MTPAHRPVMDRFILDGKAWARGATTPIIALNHDPSRAPEGTALYTSRFGETTPRDSTRKAVEAPLTAAGTRDDTLLFVRHGSLDISSGSPIPHDGAVLAAYGSGLRAHEVRAMADGDTIKILLTTVPRLPGNRPPAMLIGGWPRLLRDGVNIAGDARVRAISGVRGAMYASAAPPSFAIGMGGFQVEGRTVAPSDSLATLGAASVAPDFFAFAGIPLKAGRTFTPLADVSDRFDEDEVIINEALARRLWPNGNALGARVRRGSMTWGTVVGIVGDVRLPAQELTSRMNRDMQVYSREPGAPPGTNLLVRSDLPATVLTPAIAKALHDANPSIRVGKTSVADEVIDRFAAPQRFILSLIGAFALLAVVLASIGLYGVIGYAVRQRTREIGVRIALGALPADITRLVLRDGLALASGGVFVGVAVALAATRALRTLLYGVQPGDPITLVAVSAGLFVVAAATSYWPARRAAAVDPVLALRAD
ncbi:MAG TPA: FtsX-like permease family protein [Gemmatimonadaceae bacterium]|jgi:hypothetical protein|nr:FtsX-like permease family protein [Gemmatimonadaceae bacterium]